MNINPFDTDKNWQIAYHAALEKACALGKEGRARLNEIEMIECRMRIRRARARKRYLEAVQAARLAEIMAQRRAAQRAFDFYLSLASIFLMNIAATYRNREFAAILTAWQEAISTDQAERDQLTAQIMKIAKACNSGSESDDDDDDGGAGGFYTAPAEDEAERPK